MLHSAAESGDIDGIEKLLSLGVDVNSRNSCGSTPLKLLFVTGELGPLGVSSVKEQTCL